MNTYPSINSRLEHGASGWVAPLPPLRPSRCLETSIEVDAVVIGAGLTGIAIARRLSELRPDWNIAILEAQRVAESTSGRASGFVVDLTDAAAARLNKEARSSYVCLARNGIELLRTLVREHEIDCDWDETGWIRAAAGPRGERALDPLPELYRELGIDFLELDGRDLQDITGTTFYRRGLRLPGYPLTQTAALTRGLADLLPENVTLFEETPVERIDGEGPYRLRTRDGEARSPRLFVATNGYTPSLGFLHRRIFPIYTFGSLTSPLNEEQQARLGGEKEWGILAMDPMGSTVRRTRDQRLLIRNTVYYQKNLDVSDQKMQQVLSQHKTAFAARFPQLPEVEFEHTWAGLMGAAHNSQINFGRFGRELYIAAAYSAAGIAMSQTTGTLLAELALGIDNPLLKLFRQLPRPTWMPPEPFRSLGGGFLAERMNRQAGAEL